MPLVIVCQPLDEFLRMTREDASIPSGMVQAKGLYMQKSAKWMVVALFLSVLAACKGRSTPEERLHNEIAAMQQSLEDRRAGEFMAAVADDFVGKGHLDRQQLERLVKARLLMHQQIGIQTGPLEVEVQSNRAVVRFQAVSMGGQSGRWLPEAGRISQVETHWREVDGRWQVYRADW